MSHFYINVILHKDVKNIEGEIGRLMSPYSENLKVPEYDHPCSCKGWEARRNARDDGGHGGNYGYEHHQLGYNVNSVENLLSEENIPFAVLLPDGTWVEKGEMGWWGMVSNRKDQASWKQSVMTIYEKYKADHIGVGLDCHI